MYSYERCAHSYKYYGSHGYPYECLLEEDRFKKPDDTCERWEEKKDG